MTSPAPFPSFARRHSGGTLLGFVLGTLFGLAVALGVAVYITKVPMPFMNKTQPRPAGDAAEVQKDWDPNTGLPGRMAPKPQPSASEAAAAPSETSAAPAAAPAPLPGKSADPLGDLARARGEAVPAPASPPAAPAAPAPAVAGTEPFQYFVQAGAFRTPEDAEQQRARLSLMGLQARVSERDQAGRMVYRVRLGPFERRDDAEKARERLGSQGVDAVLVRMQR